MTRQDLIDNGHEDVVVFENPDFDGCIIGVTTDNQAVYSLAKMVVWFYEKNNCSDEEALEFIEHNTLRALPYVENAPIVLDDL